MGYTHYWIAKKSSDEKWNEFTAACQKLHKRLPKTTDTAGGYHKEDPLQIASGNGKGKPVFDGIMVDFNGRDGEKDLGHETFSVTKHNDGWDFCKTARKPYDLLVVAVLIAAWQILDYRFASDGFTDYQSVKECDDLMPAVNFYNKVMKPEVLITEDMLWKQREEYKERRK